MTGRRDIALAAADTCDVCRLNQARRENVTRALSLTSFRISPQVGTCRRVSNLLNMPRWPRLAGHYRRPVGSLDRFVNLYEFKRSISYWVFLHLQNAFDRI